MVGPSGMTAKATKHIAAEMAGARMKTILSAPLGMMSSFRASLMPSASVCSRPNGPARFGPGRCCIRPMTRRSNQITSSVVTTSSAKIRIALTSTIQPLSWAKLTAGRVRGARDQRGVRRERTHAAPPLAGVTVGRGHVR